MTFCFVLIRDGDVLFRIVGNYGLMLGDMNGLGVLHLLDRELDDVVADYGDKNWSLLATLIFGETILSADMQTWVSQA